MWTKRFFEVILSAAALILLSPFILLTIVAVKLSSPGPAFYHSKRIGQNKRVSERRKNKVAVLNNTRNGDRRVLDLGGRPFHMLKFRTMAVAADDFGGTVTHNNDSRITKVGAFLRKTKIDELPSLINVMRGEMSIVGPRPESPDWIEEYAASEKEILRIRPGITGPSQVKYRNEESLLHDHNIQKEYLQIMHDKVSIDKEYFKKPSFTSDCRVVLETLRRLFNVAH
jgi:lipopolysaccharide/colanic/teichoic acid biosynthesis glycosyltransferase